MVMAESRNGKTMSLGLGYRMLQPSSQSALSCQHEYISYLFPPLLLHGRTVGFLQRCIDEKLVMEGILLRGPAGSGKSALVKVRDNPSTIARRVAFSSEYDVFPTYCQR